MASTTFLWLLSLMTQKVEKICFLAIIVAMVLCRCLQSVGFSPAPFLSNDPKKLILTVKIFGGAIFRFFAGYFGLNRGRKTQYKLELAKINCRFISLSLFIL